MSLSVLERLPRSTVMMGVPTFYTRLLGEPAFGREHCRSMRLFIAGSAPLLAETHQQFEQRTGHRILERYGMSETVMLVSNPYFEADGERLAGTVGVPLPGVGVRVVDDDGAQCKVGEIGAVQVNGPNVFAGYWRMPDKTKEEFTADGWFRTGDVGHFGGKDVPDRYLTLVGRSKDLIISGGYNVYPKEIEGYIDEMDDVVESAVVGVPHADFGEAVVAVVVGKPWRRASAATAIVDALKGRIANYKVPKRVFVVDDLPRNAMGKVQKNVLRERYKESFNGAQPSGLRRSKRKRRPRHRDAFRTARRHRQHRLDESGLAVGVGVAVERVARSEPALDFRVARCKPCVVAQAVAKLHVSLPVHAVFLDHVHVVRAHAVDDALEEPAVG